jgi:hypothetical protein
MYWTEPLLLKRLSILELVTQLGRRHLHSLQQCRPAVTNFASKRSVEVSRSAGEFKWLSEYSMSGLGGRLGKKGFILLYRVRLTKIGGQTLGVYTSKAIMESCSGSVGGSQQAHDLFAPSHQVIPACSSFTPLSLRIQILPYISTHCSKWGR